ncbi:class I SAM-dependent methyltransferase [Fusibacter paucivorans]|uniref:Class I SAM-dependent methyltransferase n=1 Tax=Fusibacter paucivorans TaxID=76009 RepID=A0ABS5PV03_9FIRM|nr:class I SAM-dependent methyltransferase [Fusibacter paucivorans]MBS7528436.1 class I SAM-dependent methyltransferase [Fusibacter paucivorans]
MGYKGCSIYETLATLDICNAIFRPGGLALTDEMLKSASLSKCAAILDLGCGVGTTVNHMISQYGYRAVGIDASEKMIEKGRAKYANCQLDIGSAEALPYGDGQFDAVITECALSTFENFEGVLREIMRILRPGGSILLSDIYAKSEVPSTALKNGLPSMSDIEQTVKSHGFTVTAHKDCSHLWRQYIAEFIWQAPAAVYSEFLCSIQTFKPGYFYLIAEK